MTLKEFLPQNVYSWLQTQYKADLRRVDIEFHPQPNRGETRFSYRLPTFLAWLLPGWFVRFRISFDSSRVPSNWLTENRELRRLLWHELGHVEDMQRLGRYFLRAYATDPKPWEDRADSRCREVDEAFLRKEMI